MLPQTCKECRAVDHKYGRWYHCDICDREIAVRGDGRDFTLGSWNEHVKTDDAHLKAVARRKEVRRLKLKRKKVPLTKDEQYELNQMDKKQTPMSQWNMTDKLNYLASGISKAMVLSYISAPKSTLGF